MFLGRTSPYNRTRSNFLRIMRLFVCKATWGGISSASHSGYVPLNAILHVELNWFGVLATSGFTSGVIRCNRTEMELCAGSAFGRLCQR